MTTKLSPGLRWILYRIVEISGFFLTIYLRKTVIDYVMIVIVYFLTLGPQITIMSVCLKFYDLATATCSSLLLLTAWFTALWIPPSLSCFVNNCAF